MAKFRAGAGKAEIIYTEQMLPTGGENYSSIHDLPFLSVVIFEADERYALVAVDTVMLGNKDRMVKKTCELLGVDETHVFVHAAHVLATPHFQSWASLAEWKDDFMHKQHPVNDAEAQRLLDVDNSICEAHMQALEKAAGAALNSLEPARIGIGSCEAKINVNRVIETADGWWQGVNQDGITDHTVSVLRIDNAEGKPKAVVFNCNVAPGCMEFSETAAGGRAISGDLSAAATRFVDSQFPGAVSVYTTGASGDQWQALRARVDWLDAEGHQQTKDLHEAGFTLVDILGTRLGEQVVKAVKSIRTEDELAFSVAAYSWRYTGKKMVMLREPVRSGSFEEEGEADCNVRIITSGDTAIISCGVELGVDSLSRIKAQSPYKNTFIMEFTEDGGGYMPEEIFYDRFSFQAQKSRFAKGGAEKFIADVCRALTASKKN